MLTIKPFSHLCHINWFILRKWNLNRTQRRARDEEAEKKRPIQIDLIK